MGAARLAGRWVRQPLLCGLVGHAFAFSPHKLAHWPEHCHLLLTATGPFFLMAQRGAGGLARALVAVGAQRGAGGACGWAK